MRLGKSLVVLCLAYGSVWGAPPHSTPFDESARQAVSAAAEAAAARDTARTAESTAAKADSKADAAGDKAQSAVSHADRASDVAHDATKKAAAAEDKAASADDVAKKAAEEAGAAMKKAEEAAAKADAAVKAAELKSEETKSVAREEAREEAQKVASSSTTILSNRASHVVGGYFSLWGDPFPTTTGINFAYNAYDFVRVNVGFGSDDPEVFRLNTVGLGAKLFMPGWNLSPTVGLNVSFQKNDNDKRPRTVRGFAQDGAIPYANFGFDWETGLGLNFAVGYDLPLKVGYSGTWYLNAGLFL